MAKIALAAKWLLSIGMYLCENQRVIILLCRAQRHITSMAAANIAAVAQLASAILSRSSGHAALRAAYGVKYYCASWPSRLIAVARNARNMSVMNDNDGITGAPVAVK